LFGERYFGEENENFIDILIYVDSNVFHIQGDLVSADDVKKLYCVFEQMRGLNLNVHVSEVYPFGEAK
jgi:hypothetical protein